MPETVHILSRRPLQRPSGVGTTRPMIAVTYSAGGAVPRVVYLNPEEDTAEGLKAAIEADLRDSRRRPPETLEVEPEAPASGTAGEQ